MTESERWSRRGELRAFAELLAVTGFAIAQPLLDIVGRAVQELAAAGVTPRQLVLYGLAVVFVPPLAVWVVEVLVGLLWWPARRAVHLLAIGGFVGAFVVQLLLGQIGRLPLFLLGLAAVIGSMVLVKRWKPASLWLRYASLAPLFFLGLFLFASPASDLLGTVGAGEPAPPVASPAPVVVLVLDELPTATLLGADGSIDATLFPNLAALAADGSWFRHATTTANTTYYALPAMLTGVGPIEAPPIAQARPDNLFTLLADSHELRVSEVLDLCPTSLCEPRGDLEVLGDLLDTSVTIMDRRISLRPSAESPLDSFGARLAPFGPEDLTPEAVADFVTARSTDGDRPLFAFFHSIFPHRPYVYLPDGRRYLADDGPAFMLGARIDPAGGVEDWGSGEWPATLARQRHLLQVMYADRIVGAVRDRMIAEGTYDTTGIVLLSDHGAAFDPDEPYRGIVGQELSSAMASEVLYVPFIVKEPGQTSGRVDDRNVLIDDLLPTVADLAGAEVPYDIDGVSALGPARTGDDKPLRPTVARRDGTVVLGDEVVFDDTDLWPRVEGRALPPTLGPPEDRWRVWRVGPRPELVGVAVDDLPAGTLRPASASLRDPARYDDIGDDETVPALVIADAGDLVEGTAVAIAVNSVVAAVAPVFADGDDLVVAAMVDPDLYVDGANRVELFEVADPPS